MSKIKIPGEPPTRHAVFNGPGWIRWLVGVVPWTVGLSLLTLEVSGWAAFGVWLCICGHLLTDKHI